MKFSSGIAAAIVLSFPVTGLAVCGEKGSAERAGKKIDETVGKVGEKIDDTVEKVGEKMEEAGGKIKEAAKDDKK
jgi:hypothetical protein